MDDVRPLPRTPGNEVADWTQPLDFGYIVAGANLHAFNYGLKGESDPAVFRKVLESMTIPEFKPRSGVKIQINENEPVANEPNPGQLRH